MSGDEISFTAGGTQYSGRVAGNAIEGTSKARAAARRRGRPRGPQVSADRDAQ